MLKQICALANTHGGGTLRHSDLKGIQLSTLRPRPQTRRTRKGIAILATSEPCEVPGFGHYVLDGGEPRLATEPELELLRDACGLARFEEALVDPACSTIPLTTCDAAAAIVLGQPHAGSPRAMGLSYSLFDTGLNEALARDVPPHHSRWVAGPLSEAIEAVISDVLVHEPHRPDDLEPLLWDLLGNAVGHRSYAPDWLDTPVVVEQFTDAIRITSPGCVPRPVTVTADGVTGRWSRNPKLMALLQGQGRALQQGRGLARGKVLARAAGLELSLEDGADQVQVTLRVAPLLRFRAEGELRQRLPPGEREARVLTHLHAVGKSRIRVLAETLEMKPATLRATLAALEKAGRVVRTEREPRSPKQAWKLSAAERRRFATDAAENQEN